MQSDHVTVPSSRGKQEPAMLHSAIRGFNPQIRFVLPSGKCEHSQQCPCLTEERAGMLLCSFAAGASLPPTAPTGAALLQRSTWLSRKRNKIKGGPALVKSGKDELCRSGRGRDRGLCWFQIQKVEAAARTFLPTLLSVLSAFHIHGDQVLLFSLP